MDRPSSDLLCIHGVQISLACLAVVTLMQVGEQTLAQAGLCQSYGRHNLEALMRDGLTLNQAKESVINDVSDGSKAFRHQA